MGEPRPEQEPAEAFEDTDAERADQSILAQLIGGLGGEAWKGYADKLRKDRDECDD